MKKEIPIMFCFDKNYVIPAAVAFYSLLQFADKKYKYIFYVLHSDITENQQQKLRDTIKEFDNCELKFVDMAHRLEKEWQKSYRGDHFSKEVMYKLLTASLFPQYDKIIISDVDVVFLDDISNSYFELDAIKDDAYIAGVKPIGKIKNYFDNYKNQWSNEEIEKLGEICGGYLVMNLKKIREDDLEKEFMNSLKKNSYRLNQMEQDILNLVCYGKIKHLSLKYVACSYMWDYYQTEKDIDSDENYSKNEINEALFHPVQLHYATSIKPWKNVDCTKSEVWFQFLVKTPFLEEYLKWLPYNIIIPEDRLNSNFYQNKSNGKIRKIANYIKRNPFFFVKKEFYVKVVKYVKRKFR